MSTSNRLALAGAVALAFGYAGANAAVITSITASGGGLGTFTINSQDDSKNTLDITKDYANVAPITLDFTVAHSTGNGQYDVTETLKNNTNFNWTDFHYKIVEGPNPQGQGNVFISFNNPSKTFLNGFTLDQPPVSGPRDLNYTGFLANGGASTTAGFTLNAFDPGKDKTYHFQLIQTPSIVPEPGTWAMLVAGVIGVAGMVRRRISS